MNYNYSLILSLVLMPIALSGARPPALPLKAKEPSGSSTLVVAPPGGPAVPQTLSKDQKEKIDAVNKQLASLGGDHNRKKRKEIITRAVNDGIHPDLLAYNGSPLSQAVLFNDFDDAQFLLQHDANPNGKCEGSKDPILEVAKTAAMAQLLFNHGGQITVAAHGPELLQHTCSLYAPETALTKWYLDQGVDPNQYYDGKTPLLKLVFFGDTVPLCKHYVERARMLMQAGALLSCEIKDQWHYYKGYTTPQLVKMNIEVAQKELKESADKKLSQERLVFLNQLRASLIQVSKFRHEQLQRYLIERLLPPLSQIVVDYYIAREPRYEDLESVPYPIKQNSNEGFGMTTHDRLLF